MGDLNSYHSLYWRYGLDDGDGEFKYIFNQLVLSDNK